MLRSFRSVFFEVHRREFTRSNPTQPSEILLYRIEAPHTCCDALHASGPSFPIAIAAGMAHTCAVLGDMTVSCWGSNSHGQLGTGDTTNLLRPVVEVMNITGGINSIYLQIDK